MSAQLDKLVRMANQIAEALTLQAADPAAATAEHLRAFWAPAMREKLIAHNEAGAPGLSPLAAQAVARLTPAGGNRSGQ